VDWGEAFVALQFVLKPAFDELFMTQFGRLARAAGDDALERMFFSLNEDCAWHRVWSGPLLRTASRAIAAFHPIFDEMLPGGGVRFAPMLSEIEQFCQGYQESLFGLRDLLPGESK
jgi:hypothetical protein